MTAAALALLCAVPAHAAPAALPRPSELPACSDPGATTAGGWDNRQTTFQGTDADTFVGQIRPRTVRAGEVCVGADNITVPIETTDVPPADDTYNPGAGGDSGWSDTRLVTGADTSGSGVHYFECLMEGTPLAGGTTACVVTQSLAGQALTNMLSAWVMWCYPEGGGAPYSNGYPEMTDPSGGNVEPGDIGIDLIVSWPECTGDPDDNIYSFNRADGTHEPDDRPLRGGANSLTGQPQLGWFLDDFDPGAGGGSTVGATQGSPFRVGGGSDTTASVICATSADGAGESTTPELTYSNFDQDYLPDYADDDDDHSSPDWSRQDNVTMSVPATSCPFVVAVRIAVGHYNATGQVVFEHFTWTADRWSAQVPYSDQDPNTAACVLYPAWQGCNVVLEPEIVCDIEYTDPGNPITVIAEFFGGIGPWVGCIFTPRGWDRANQIATTWNNGNIADLSGAYNNAVPNGIACGDVGTFAMPWGTTAIDTCDADFAPSWVKVGVSAVIVLGIAALAVRRVVWAVGSRA